MEVLDRFTEIIIVAITAFILGVLIGYMYGKSPKATEGSTAKIDSLITVNDSIKIKVEKLDSIKNAKVIEVQTLDNDSTLKLFYELVSE